LTGTVTAVALFTGQTKTWKP